MTLASKVNQIEEEKLKKNACEISIKEGSAYSIMDGFGLRYVVPYALTLGASNANIGILSSLPNLIGSFSELYTVKLMKKFSRKSLVFWGILLQALMWLVIIGIGSIFLIYNIDHTVAPNSLVIAFTLLVLFGSFTVPAWTSWMKDIVPEQFNTYFGVRNRITGIVSLISMLVAGYLLDYYKRTHIFLGFAILFFVAFIGRALSAYLFTKTYEPKCMQITNYHDGLKHFMKSINKNNFGKFTRYYSLLALFVSIASPFFAVYMLSNLHFSYLSFTLVVISPLLVRLAVFPAWGRFADKYGNMKVIKITGYLIPLIPFLWLLSIFVPESLIVAYLVTIEAFSGLIWAGFDLSTGNFIFDSFPSNRVAMASADFTILANLGAFIGAVIGGFISSQTWNIMGLDSVLIVFLLSGIFRFFIGIIMIPGIKEVRTVEKFDVQKVEKALLHMPHGRFARLFR